MLKSRYLLAFCDENFENKWHVINRQFILERTDKINSVSGVFLQDIWFNYKLKSAYSDNDKQLKFMIIKSRNYVNMVNKIINNEVDNIETEMKKYIFKIQPDNINKKYEDLHKKSLDRSRFKIKCEENENINFNIEIFNYENENFITLPRFNIY